MRILLVDDEPDIVDAVKEGLELRGVSVDAFIDSEKALQAFRTNTYDVALLDIRMPKMNGFQLYREIEKRDGKVRVRFFTAFETYREEFKKAFPELDERRFIKPITISRLADELLTTLEVNVEASKPDE
jgi:two-component system, OmpR family, response regulator ChvI